MIVQDLVNAAADAALTAVYHSAREAAFKAAAVGEAERLRQQAGGAVNRLASDQGLGELRLDAANLPASPLVDDPVALGEWMAQRDDTRPYTHAEITVPVDRLEEALAVLEFAGFAPQDRAATTVVADQKAALAWLVRHARVMAAPDLPSGYCVVHGTGDEREVVPGAIGVKPVPRWVLKADDDRRKENIATAQTEVDGYVTDLRQQSARDLTARQDVDADAEQAASNAILVPADDDPPIIDVPPDVDPDQGGEPLPQSARVRAEAEATVAHATAARIAGRLRAAAVEQAAARAGGHDAAEIEPEDDGFPPGPFTLPRRVEEHPSAAYAGKKATALQDECRDRGLPVSGTKPELVDRLVAHDLSLSRPGWTARL